MLGDEDHSCVTTVTIKDADNDEDEDYDNEICCVR